MDKLPTYAEVVVERPRSRKTKLHRVFALCSLSVAIWLWSASRYASAQNGPVKLPLHAHETLQKCQMLNVKPGPPSDFAQRSQSDRFVEGTRATLLKNASVWTGDPSTYELYNADILVDKGMIKFIGQAPQRLLARYKDLVTVEVDGRWVTPGIVDLHSHLGVDSSPSLAGASDTNSHKGPILPWLRSLDGMNTHDDAYRLSISGGVTTANVLPGSANAIGGQAFVIKLRPTDERSPSSMLLEPPYTINGTHVHPSLPPRWRQMKHACGENPSRVYGNTRMDTFWAFRQAYDTARQIKESQDNYCLKAMAGEWNGLGDFPEDLQWEALVDVLRGRVKVHTHCYETVDLDDFVRLTNEFQFPVAAFHHAHETYLVPSTLKRAYNHTPAAAIFATNARYKREAYRGSEFAARILYESGIDVVMKSDHPVLNSRYLLYEAQQAHYYGLPPNQALSAVTSTPAKVMGQDHRIGSIREGYDADIVLWDSHPLALGATPEQVWIDGIPQFDDPQVSKKPLSFQTVPSVPDFDKEAAAAVHYDGLPPLLTTKAKSDTVLLYNTTGVVVLNNGEIDCYGSYANCIAPLGSLEPFEWADLQGGSISPGLITYGSSLGLDEIQGERSTRDGLVFDPLSDNVPSILSGSEVIKAVDGLQFAGRDMLIAYRAGVTSGVTAPTSSGLVAGLSTAFSTGAAHGLEKGAVIQGVTALHVTVGYSWSGSPSVSTQIAVLRHLLLDSPSGTPFSLAAQGELPLVVQTHSADIIASLIKLKKEIEFTTNTDLKMTVAGAAEAHLLAKELSEANIGVIVSPSRPFPEEWQMKRILPGPPLTKDSTITTLLAHGVTVGIGIVESWSARNTRLDMAWAALESNGQISKSQALALASINLERLLGIKGRSSNDLVMTRSGTIFDVEAKIVGIISSRQGIVEWVM
ncbi:composite domain of metallo-dependent hydrolase [Phlebopus sp. FC_14]|nr:composite domain of metallo-dependent hydrolase [Phlebopus sp. FC_14]